MSSIETNGCAMNSGATVMSLSSFLPSGISALGSVTLS